MMPARSDAKPGEVAGRDDVARLCAMLARAHATRQPVTGVEAGSLDVSLAEAYEAQAGVSAGLGRTAGWKVGRKSPTGPFSYAPLFESRLHRSGVTLRRNAFSPWQIEAELMVRFGHALPRLGRPYERAEVVAAIAEVMPAIEIIDSRFAAWPAVPAPLLLADLLSHGAMVLGSGRPLPAEAKLERTRVRLTMGEDLVVDQEGGNPAGDLIDLVHGLVNRLAEIGRPVAAGDLVTTGSFTGMRPLPPATRAEASFEGIGSVALARAA